MEEENKKEEIQSRREFFKNAAKKGLPIVAAIALAGMPTVANAVESTTCKYGCVDGCADSCLTSCKTKCDSLCHDVCINTCKGECKGGCKDTCETSCKKSSR